MPYNKIAVVGPGNTALPAAARLASRLAPAGLPLPRVVAVQRDATGSEDGGTSTTAGAWVGPTLGDRRQSANGDTPSRLILSRDFGECSDAEVVLAHLPHLAAGTTPDHRELVATLQSVAEALRLRPIARRPLVIIESALAPSTMRSVVEPLFASHGLVDGRDVLLGNSPDMAASAEALGLDAPIERIVAGMHPESPVEAGAFYRSLTNCGRLHVTNSLSAEIAESVRHAWLDMRLAFSLEIARYCDRIGVDFRTLRDRVNDLLPAQLGNARLPMPGADHLPPAGFHVLGPTGQRPGNLIWWRAKEAGLSARDSLILTAQAVNESLIASVARLARLEFGSLNGRRITVLGATTVAGSPCASGAPGLALATLLLDSGADVILHDPLVSPGDHVLRGADLASRFTNDLDEALAGEAAVIIVTPHTEYRELVRRITSRSPGVRMIVDACAILDDADLAGTGIVCTGIGRGRAAPDGRLVGSVASMFHVVARGAANEFAKLVDFLDTTYSCDAFNRADLGEVRRLAASGPLGVHVDEPGPVLVAGGYNGFVSGLAQLATDAAPPRRVPARQPSPAALAGLWLGNIDSVLPEVGTPWPLTQRN